MKDAENRVLVLCKKVAELEETVKFILKRIKIDLKDLPVLPEFLKGTVGSSFSVEQGDDGYHVAADLPGAEAASLKTLQEAEELLVKQEDEEITIDVDKITQEDYNDCDWEPLDTFTEHNIDQGGLDCADESYRVTDNEATRETRMEVTSGPKVFMSNKNLIPHVQLPKLKEPLHKSFTRSSSTTYKCGKCRMGFPTFKLLWAHKWKERHHNLSTADQGEKQCNICFKIVPSRAALQKHKRVENHWLKKSDLLKPRLCDVCEETFPTLKSLREHQKLKKHGVRKRQSVKQKLEEETGIIVDATKLPEKSHSRLKETEPEILTRSWKCSVCSLAFLSRRLLMIHEKKTNHLSNINSDEITPGNSEPFNEMKMSTTPGNHFEEENFCGDEMNDSEENETTNANEATSALEIKPDKVWFCQLCSQTFPTSRSLSKHKMAENHFVKRGKKGAHSSYKCSICSASFTTLTTLRHHKRRHKTKLTRKWNCLMCPASFPKRILLEAHRITQNHRKKHKGIRKTVEVTSSNTSRPIEDMSATSTGSQGEVTGVETDKDKGVAPFVIGKRRRTPWPCGVCPQTFPTSRALGRHKKEENHYVKRKRATAKEEESQSPKCWSCRVCSQLFLTGRSLEKHKKEKNHYLKKRKPKGESDNSTDPAVQPVPKKTNWSCQICSATFSNPGDLERHKKAENHLVKFSWKLKDRPKDTYICVICTTSFTTQADLKSHQMQEKHFRRLGPCSCPYCGKYMSRGPKSINHIRTHTKEKPFLCGSCGGSFKTEAYLKNHEKYQHGSASLERPYQCKYCGSNFKTAPQLKVHEDLHERKHDKKCPECGTICRNLKLHIREVHENVRAFKCHLCEMAFKKKTHLTRHLNSHKNPNRKVKGYHIERPEKRNIFRGLAIRTVEPMNIGSKNFELEMAELKHGKEGAGSDNEQNSDKSDNVQDKKLN